MTPEQANELHQVYMALWAGGSSMGPAVPDPINTGAGTYGNAVVDLLQHTRCKVDAGVPVTMSAADRAAVAELVAQQVGSRLDALLTAMGAVGDALAPLGG